jgi:hypothetical protein
LGTDIVHTGLVKAAFGETNKGGLQDLGPSIESGFELGLRHEVEKMNERSFIVKSTPNSGEHRASHCPVSQAFH